MSKKVILISGKARSGKDTLARVLKDYLKEQGKDVLITHYADSLKYICEIVFKWDGKKDEKGRQLLIDIGESVRKYNQNYWVDCLKSAIKGVERDSPSLSSNSVYIVADCRYENEIMEMKEFSPLVIRVEREHQLFRNGLTLQQSLSKSETELDSFSSFDITVHNDFKTVEEYKKYVQEVLAKEVLKWLT